MNIRHGLALALLALVAAPQSVTAAEGWRMVTTEHLRVLSQAGDRQTQLWIRAELNPLFEQLLAYPAVTQELRNMVETTRARIKQ
jgi:hypothetical protein